MRDSASWCEFWELVRDIVRGVVRYTASPSPPAAAVAGQEVLVLVVIAVNMTVSVVVAVPTTVSPCLSRVLECGR